MGFFPGNRESQGLMRTFILWFIGDEDGQDLVEYAFLTVFVALVGGLAFNLLETTIQTVYTGWDSAEQDRWRPPDP